MAETHFQYPNKKGAVIFTALPWCERLIKHTLLAEWRLIVRLLPGNTTGFGMTDSASAITVKLQSFPDNHTRPPLQLTFPS